MPSCKNSRRDCESTGIVMLTGFFVDNLGVGYLEFMPRGCTINLENSRKAIKDRRPGKLVTFVMFAEWNYVVIGKHDFFCQFPGH